MARYTFSVALLSASTVNKVEEGTLVCGVAVLRSMQNSARRKVIFFIRMKGFRIKKWIRIFAL